MLMSVRWTVIFVLLVNCCFVSSSALQGQSPADAAVSEMERHRSKGDWRAMEKALLKAVSLGRRDEYTLRSLSWANARLGKGDRALMFAQQNYRQHPCSWSRAQLVDATLVKGDYVTARRQLRSLVADREDWGSASGSIESLIDQASIKTYQFVWTIDPQKHIHLQQNSKSTRIPLPTTDLPYQTATWSIAGARESEEVTVNGNRCLLVTPDGHKTFTLTAEVTFRPMSYRARLAGRKQGDVPKEVLPYLEGIGGVDPSDPLIQRGKAKLGTDDPVTTVENILHWCNKKIVYDGGPPGTSGGTAVEVLRRGKGHCEARSSVAISLLRACGIPARHIRGHSAVVGESGHPQWHTIVEYYLHGIGWIPWDYDYEPFQVRTTYLRTFHYDSPYDCPIPGDRSVVDLWNFQSVGLNCDFVKYDLIHRSLDEQKMGIKYSKAKSDD